MYETREISHSQRETQERIFEAARKRGLTLKAISVLSGVPVSTLRTWAGENGATALMSIDGLFKLCGVIPDDLLSMLLPTGRVIVRMPEEIDHDQVEDLCRDFLAAKGKAHHPDSPGGREISPCEEAMLDAKVVQLRAVA